MGVLDQALVAVLQLINGLGLFAFATFGALPTQPGIVANLGPSSPDSVYMDKNAYISLDVTINAKHPDIQLLMSTMARIHSQLTREKSYPSGDGWEIVDIVTQTLPQIIGREPDNGWLMASSLSVRVYQTGV